MGEKAQRDTEFTEYVTAKAPWLRKVAYLLCGDWHRADDLMQSGITKLYTNWNRATRVDNLDGYVRKIVVNTFLAEQRTGWRRLVDLHATGVEGPSPVTTEHADVLDLREALTKLPPKQRAAVVLRYYCDLPVDEVAGTLNCSPGTVKSQTARGIDALRRLLGTHATVLPEVRS